MERDEYEVGYRRPPKHTQFKKGQSGNPKGRPKGTRNLRTDLSEELAETVFVRDGERRRSITKQRALVKALMARALSGDARATATLMGLIERSIGLEGASAGREEGLSHDEAAILELLGARLVGVEEASQAVPVKSEGSRSEREEPGK